mgnify:CR=1 FL=1
MRRMMRGCAVALWTMALAVPVGAQSHDEHDVRATVEQIFDGMRTADADLVREVLAPGVRFAGVGDEASPLEIAVTRPSATGIASADDHIAGDEAIQVAARHPFDQVQALRVARVVCGVKQVNRIARRVGLTTVARP